MVVLVRVVLVVVVLVVVGKVMVLAVVAQMAKPLIVVVGLGCG